MTISEMMDVVIMRIVMVDQGHLRMMTHVITVSGMIGVILTILNNIGPFPVEMADDSVLTCCASVLAMDEAVIVTDLCSGDPRAQSVRNGPEFRRDPDSDRMPCRPWIPSTLDTSVMELQCVCWIFQWTLIPIRV